MDILFCKNIGTFTKNFITFMTCKKQIPMKHTGNIARILLLSLFATVFISFSGCIKNNDNIIEETTLDENGYTDYKLNNPERCGYILYISTGLLTAPLSDYIETNVNRVSGYEYDWQGTFLNYSDGSHFLAVLVNTKGSYLILKANGQNISYYNGSTWTSSQYLFASLALNLGYNQINTIKIAATAPNTYQVSFNGATATTFSETELPAGLYKGFIFSIASKDLEGFPDNIYEVKFKELYAQ